MPESHNPRHRWRQGGSLLHRRERGTGGHGLARHADLGLLPAHADRRALVAPSSRPRRALVAPSSRPRRWRARTGVPAPTVTAPYFVRTGTASRRMRLFPSGTFAATPGSRCERSSTGGATAIGGAGSATTMSPDGVSTRGLISMTNGAPTKSATTAKAVRSSRERRVFMGAEFPRRSWRCRAFFSRNLLSRPPHRAWLLGAVTR